MTVEFPAFFDGQRQRARSGQTLEAFNPATGESLGHFPRCDAQDVEIAVSSALRAARSWRELSAGERAQCILRFADRVEADAQRLILLDVRDNGSPISEMAIDVVVGVKQLRYFAGLAYEAQGRSSSAAFDRLNVTMRQPFGVCAQLIPFNHPLMFALKTIGAPLVTGNTVIVKPSEHTSLSALALADHIEACFPPGVLSILPGLGAEAGDALVTHPKVRRLHFIGGDRVGRAIQARAASVAVKSVTLELGGKNPLVIWPDADIEAALDGAMRGMRFNFQGQACGSTSRLLLPHEIRDTFLDELAVRISALKVGLPEDPETQVGAVIHRPHMERVLGYIDAGRTAGGRVLAGGAQLTQGALAAGCFVAPTLVTDLPSDNPLWNEEVFGPVLSAAGYRDYEDMLAIANGTSYGLTASLYTRDFAIAHRFARDVEAGYVWINDNQSHFIGTPYGGNKDSGLGREEDSSEMFSYTETKNVNFRF